MLSKPAALRAAQFRVARPTDRLEEVVRFYREGVGLAELFAFAGHAGYDGVMLGIPGQPYHLEFTAHEKGSPCPAPTRDNLLVFYMPDQAAYDEAVARLERLGVQAVEPENPYWAPRGSTFEDPDGWRVVLVRPESAAAPATTKTAP